LHKCTLFNAVISAAIQWLQFLTAFAFSPLLGTKAYHYPANGQTTEMKACPNVFQRFGMVKKHVGKIVLVVPIFEINGIGQQLGHANQFSSIFQHRPELLELAVRMMKMLNHLAAYNIIVLLLQQVGMVMKKRIVHGYAVATMAKHMGNS